MAREFPFATVGTTTTNGVEYSYTDNLDNLFSNGSLEFANYPTNLFWGGVDKNDAAFMYPAVAEYSFDNESISMKNLFNVSLNDRNFPTSQISYCYTQPAGLMGYVTNYNIDDGNLNYTTYSGVSNFKNIASNTKFVSKISLCKAIFSAYVLYYEKTDWNNNGVAFDSPKSTSIKQFEIWEQDGTADGLIIVGFSASNSRGETGYINNSNVVYMNGYQYSDGTPINALMGNLWKNPFQNYQNEYTGFSIPIQASGQNREHYMATSGGLGYYSTTYNRDLYGDENNAFGCPYNGDFTFDISSILAIDTKNTTYKIPYTDGDKYICGGSTSGEFYWSSVRFNGRIYRVYKNIDDLLKYIMGFGMAFYGGAVSRYSHTEGSIIDNYVFAPVLDAHNIYRGEYTRGLKNAANDFFERTDSTETDYEPSDEPPTPPEDDSDTLGADITGFDFTLTPLSAANNFTTLYALTTGQLAAFGRTLWAKLWSEDFWKSVGTTFLNDFSINPADMMRYFINLHYFPFDLSVYPWSSTDGVYVGRAVEPIAVDTRVFSRNLIQIDGGVCAVPAYYNDFRDYEPCTNVEITIPFCGNVQIAPSECIGKVLSLTYTVDMQTGAITALVYVNSDKKYIVAQLSGQCAATIPITADNNLEFVGRIAKVTGATLFEGIKSGAEMFKESESVKGSIGIGAAVGIASGAAAVTGLPPVAVHKMGDSGGFANYGGAYRAYITVTRQKYSVPSNYGGTVGYAADFTATVGSLSGLFACQNVDTGGLTCNYDERAEIKRLLESGCYM